MIGVDELKNQIAKRIQDYVNHDNPMATRTVISIGLDKAVGHVLASQVVASFDVPRQNLSAMDGFAFGVGSRLDNNARLEIIGESCAGVPFVGQILPNQGVRIFTGAVVPDGCDTVVMQENTDFETIKRTLDKHQAYHITLTKPAKIGANIRHQGEEIQQDELLLSPNKRLTPSDISLLASMGVEQIKVFKPLVVGLIATGDELVAIGEPLAHLAQIYNSNTPTLKALLARLPIVLHDYGIIKDDLQATTDGIKRAIDECDVIISSAGVSVGDYDFLTQVVDKFGKINHYKVAMKPGKPFVFGEFKRTDGQVVLYFGLPGNPLSTVVGCLNFVRPALWQMVGADVPTTLRLNAKTTHAIHKNAGRKEYQRGFFEQKADGELVVTPAVAQDSHRIKQLAYANCLIVLDENNTGVAAGSEVVIEPFDWTFG